MGRSWIDAAAAARCGTLSTTGAGGPVGSSPDSGALPAALLGSWGVPIGDVLPSTVARSRCSTCRAVGRADGFSARQASMSSRTSCGSGRKVGFPAGHVGCSAELG